MSLNETDAVFDWTASRLTCSSPGWMRAHLPNLARLLQTGASGPLRSTIPPVSASAWPSFATGTNPGQHSLVDFTYPAPDGYDIRVSNGLTVAVPAIWQNRRRCRGAGGRRQLADDLSAATTQRFHAVFIPDTQRRE